MRFSMVLAICCLQGAALAADPVLGTWTLNLQKSRYIPGPTPRAETRIYEAHPDGIKVTIKTTSAEGKVTAVEHPVNYDGKAHHLRGSERADAIALQKIDDYTSESILKHAGKVIGTNRRVVSKDGKSMTITFEGTGANGLPVKNTAVYDKQ